MSRLFKVAYFVVDKIAEPVAEALSRIAARSPAFQTACRRVARAVSAVSVEHVFDRAGVAVRRRAPSLTDEQAAKLGTEILAEGLVWSLGLLVLGHQTLAENEADAMQDHRLHDYETRLREVEHALEVLRAPTGDDVARPAALGVAEYTPSSWRSALGAHAMSLRAHTRSALQSLLYREQAAVPARAR
jgi:predicted neutral ceramidase superfamily lipid hydrolase